MPLFHAIVILIAILNIIAKITLNIIAKIKIGFITLLPLPLPLPQDFPPPFFDCNVTNVLCWAELFRVLSCCNAFVDNKDDILHGHVTVT